MTKKGNPHLASTKQALDDLIIAWIAMGLTLLQIAWNLKIGQKAVEYRWARIKRERGFECYQDATRYAIKTKLIPLKIRYE